jgi:hypothetical protein
VVLSETLARRLFPGDRAVGMGLVRLDGDSEPVSLFDRTTRQALPLPPYTVAGVVRDVRDHRCTRAAAKSSTYQ